MNNIKNFKTFVNENLTSNEMDYILDKISKDGIDSLSDEDKKKLNDFTGEYSEPEKQYVEIDNDGDLRIGGERANPYNIPDDLYDNTLGEIDRELTIDLKKEIEYFLDDEYYVSGQMIIDYGTKKSIENPSEIIERISGEFGISLIDAEKILKKWHKIKTN